MVTHLTDEEMWEEERNGDYEPASDIEPGALTAEERLVLFRAYAKATETLIVDEAEEDEEEEEEEEEEEN